MVVELRILELRQVEVAAWRMRRTLMWFENRSPRSDSTRADARARSSPTTTIPSSRATTRQRGVREAPGVRVSATTASMMSFAAQSEATGTKARVSRSATIATVRPACVCQTRPTSAGR